MIFLGIETSCDDTGVALYDGARECLLAHALYSQVECHAQYGGVVPELASRDHIRKIIPLIQAVMAKAKIQTTQIRAIAYTAGPGLTGSLMVGACVAESLAVAWGIPCVPVHHLEGHLLAPMLEDNPPAFPFLALLVSGGHTQLLEVKTFGKYKLLGESLDDAVGEAFDKTAKLMKLGYPGGPAVATLAQQGIQDAFVFPRPLTHKPGLDFSFSGLKTHTRNAYQATEQTEQDKANIARAFEEAVVDTLAIKCERALQHTGLRRLVVAGGVAANAQLRKRLSHLMQQLDSEVFYPRQEFCTDNGAMIAYAGYRHFKMGHVSDSTITVKARWPLESYT